MANEIEVEIVARLDSVDKSIKSLEDKAERAGKEIGKDLGDGLADKVSGSFKSMAGAAAAAIGAIASAFAVNKVIEEASNQEAAVNRLNQSLASAGTYSQEASQRIQEFANNIQRTTNVADDAALSYVALARNFAKTNEQAVALTKAAIDLAAATGDSVESSVEKLGKTLSGTAGRLGQAVPVLRQFTEEQLRAGAAIDAVESRFSGSAASQINTFSGAVKQLKNTFSDLLEEVGNLIIKSPVVRDVIKFLSEQFIRLTESVKKIAGNEDILGNLIKSTIQWGKALNEFVVAPLELAYNVGKIFLNGFLEIIQTVISGLATGVSFVTGLLAKISDKFVDIDASVRTFAESSSEVLADFSKNTEESINNVFDFDFTAKADEGLSQLQRVVESAKQVNEDYKNNVREIAPVYAITFDTIKQLFNKFANDSAERLRAVRQEAETLVGYLKTGFINGIANAFSAVGASLVNGSNGFEAFGKSILRTLGQLAIQVGSFFIAVGAGLAATTILFGFSGAAAIAAGVALVTLGGALQALAGGGGGKGGGAEAASSSNGAQDSGGGVSAGTAAPIGESLTSAQSVERQAPGTSVEVNIAGNVLGDKRTLGRAIAEAINESFGADGTVIARGALV